MQRQGISSRLFDTYLNERGERFLAYMESPEFSSAAKNSPRRVLHARKPTKLTNGSLVMETATKEYYLLEGFQSEYPQCKSFKAYQVTQIYTWQTQGYTTDLVTGFKVKSATTTGKDIYTTVEPLKGEGFFSFSEQVHQFVTNQRVSTGDLVGTFMVKTVTEVNGLYHVVTQPK